MANTGEGTRPTQLTQTGQTDISNIDCHAQDINWGKPAQMVSGTAQGAAGHSSAGGEQLYCASFFLVFLGILFTTVISITIVFQFISIITLFLSHPMSFTFFPDSPLHSMREGTKGEGNKQLHGT